MAGSLVGDLLSRAHPRPPAATAAIDVNEIVQDVVRLVGPVTRRDLVSLETDLAPGAAYVALDRSRLIQLVLNLIVNARDAAPAGGRIRVTTEHGPGTATIRVVDDGVGICDEHLPRIFEPEFTTKGDSGCGLGLATVASVVEECGGNLTVESTPECRYHLRRDDPTPPRCDRYVEPHAAHAGPGATGAAAHLNHVVDVTHVRLTSPAQPERC